MGAWGEGSFDNDTACDWSYQLEDANDLSIIEATIDMALESDEDSLDADAALEAIAACEVLARLKGHFGVRDSYTEAADNWVEAHPLKPAGKLIKRAEKAIDRVIDEESELRQIWDESGSEKWLAAVEDLRQRLIT